MDKWADFSPDREYRYTLWRRWDTRPCVLFIGLNPSTADELSDDPTIRRCVDFAQIWGYGGLCMVNLFALRATNPQDMLKHCLPIGVTNNERIKRLTKNSGINIAAWGVNGGHLGQDRIICEMIPNLYCLGLTKKGFPRHPLYLRKDAELIPFAMEK